MFILKIKAPLRPNIPSFVTNILFSNMSEFIGLSQQPANSNLATESLKKMRRCEIIRIKTFPLKNLPTSALATPVVAATRLVLISGFSAFWNKISCNAHAVKIMGTLCVSSIRTKVTFSSKSVEKILGNSKIRHFSILINSWMSSTNKISCAFRHNIFRSTAFENNCVWQCSMIIINQITACSKKNYFFFLQNLRILRHTKVVYKNRNRWRPRHS